MLPEIKSPKKCPQNWNVWSELKCQNGKCHQNCDITKSKNVIKPEILLKRNYVQNYWITLSYGRICPLYKWFCQIQIQEISNDCICLVLFWYGLKTKEATHAAISLQHCSTCIFVLLRGTVQPWPAELQNCGSAGAVWPQGVEMQLVHLNLIK